MTQVSASRLALAGLAFSLIWLWSPLSRADHPALERGVEAFNSGEFRRSLDLLRKSAARVKDPRSRGRLQLYIGLNQAFLGQRKQARRSFRRALVHDPALQVDPVRIRPDVVKLFQQARSGMAGELVVSSRLPSALVVVDGVERGAAPLRLRLTVGRHRLEVLDARRSPRYRGWVVVHQGKVTPVQVMAPVAGAGQGALFEVRPGPVRSPRRHHPGEPSTTRRRRLWTWVAAGGAAVAGGVALGLVLSGASDYEEYQTSSCSPRLTELEQSIRRKYTASYVMWGIAGAATVAAVVLFFLEGRRTERPAKVGRLSAGPGGLGLAF